MTLETLNIGQILSLESVSAHVSSILLVVLMSIGFLLTLGILSILSKV